MQHDAFSIKSEGTLGSKRSGCGPDQQPAQPAKLVTCAARRLQQSEWVRVGRRVGTGWPCWPQPMGRSAPLCRPPARTQAKPARPKPTQTFFSSLKYSATSSHRHWRSHRPNKILCGLPEACGSTKTAVSMMSAELYLGPPNHPRGSLTPNHPLPPPPPLPSRPPFAQAEIRSQGK